MIILAKSTKSMPICKDNNDFDNMSYTTESLQRLNHSSLTDISSNITIPSNDSTWESNEIDDFDCAKYESYEYENDSYFESSAGSAAIPSGTMTIYGFTLLLNRLFSITLWLIINDLNILPY